MFARTSTGKFYRKPFVILLIVLIALVAASVPIAIYSYRNGGTQTAQTNTAMGKCSTLPQITPLNSADIKSGLIYEIMVDRFFEGAPNKSIPANDTAPTDPTHQNWHAYWGGDLQGITDKIPYLAGMGVSAIWITPIVENITQPAYGDQAGYHGYWAQDDYQIDPHFGTWSDFDTLVQTAHSHGIQVIVDFAANHSNPRNTGADGAIYKNGVLQASYGNDPNNWFHHTQNQQSDSLYQQEYGTLEDLSDFAQENPAVDAYLKGAILQFSQHGADGFRFDSVKSMPGPTGGWLKTVSDAIEAKKPSYLVGEWYLTGGTGAVTYSEAAQFANSSGMAILNFPIDTALRDVYGVGLSSPNEINSTLQQEYKDFLWPNDLPNFIDNHDMARFLSLNSSHTSLNEALTAMMTIPGIPIVYYGTEQYLVNNNNSGEDPYNRPMMPGFSTTTQAYHLISCLAALRRANPALAYGNYAPIKITHDVYLFERQFGQSVVVTAINSSADTTHSFTNLQTALPAGSYTDVLGGLQGGSALQVGAQGMINSVALQPNEIAVWQYTAPDGQTPLLGSAAPELTHPGDTMILDGQGFGASGTVQIGGVSAKIIQWSTNSVSVTVPQIPGGLTTAKICNSAGCSGAYSVNIASAAQVPVNFTLNGLPTLTSSDHVYITGNVAELGNNSLDITKALGPMVTPDTGNVQFLLASLPACASIQYRYFIEHADGSYTMQSGSAQTYTVPCSGEGAITDNWQGK